MVRLRPGICMYRQTIHARAHPSISSYPKWNLCSVNGARRRHSSASSSRRTACGTISSGRWATPLRPTPTVGTVTSCWRIVPRTPANDPPTAKRIRCSGHGIRLHLPRLLLYRPPPDAFESPIRLSLAVKRQAGLRDTNLPKGFVDLRKTKRCQSPHKLDGNFLQEKSQIGC
jgi:hypothetical protein